VPKHYLIAIVGAAVGGAIGYFAFGWILRSGFYALVLPGGLMGLGATLGRVRSLPLAVALAIAAVILGFFAEWSFRPFAKDDSLNYFLAHLGDLTPVTIIMIGVGALVAFWGAFDPIGQYRAGA
jgi:nitrogen fixation-related uncharacterized protein